MSSQNNNDHTPINDMVQQHQSQQSNLHQQGQSHPGGPEYAPPSEQPQELGTDNTNQIEGATEKEKNDVDVDRALAPRQQSTPHHTPAELQKAGLKRVQPVRGDPRVQNVKLPIDDSMVLKGQQAPITSSYRWLAEFCKYLLDKAHIKLKRVGNKVIRVISK